MHLRRRIGELDGQMGDVGRALGEKVGSVICSIFLRLKQVVETSAIGAKKGRAEHGRRHRNATDMLAVAGPRTSRGRDDTRRKILGSSSSRTSAPEFLARE